MSACSRSVGGVTDVSFTPSAMTKITASFKFTLYIYLAETSGNFWTASGCRRENFALYRSHPTTYSNSACYTSSNFMFASEYKFVLIYPCGIVIILYKNETLFLSAGDSRCKLANSSNLVQLRRSALLLSNKQINENNYVISSFNWPLLIFIWSQQSFVPREMSIKIFNAQYVISDMKCRRNAAVVQILIQDFIQTRPVFSQPVLMTSSSMLVTAHPHTSTLAGSRERCTRIHYRNGPCRFQTDGKDYTERGKL